MAESVALLLKPAETASGQVTRPVRLDVGSIGVHTGLIMLGLKADGTVQVPEAPGEAGWY